MSVCKKCNRVFEYCRAKGHRLTVCNSCFAKAKNLRCKKKAVDYKGGKCVRCGYSIYLGALHFHHRDPSKKEFGIGFGFNRSWEKIKVELDKCDLVCANCHAEIHAGLL